MYKDPLYLNVIHCLILKNQQNEIRSFYNNEELGCLEISKIRI